MLPSYAILATHGLRQGDFGLLFTQTYLEAAQKTFMQTQRLSLFDQIS